MDARLLHNSAQEARCLMPIRTLHIAACAAFLVFSAASPRAEPPRAPEQPTDDASASVQERVLTVRPRDSLVRLLDGAGFVPVEAHAAATALSRVFRPADLRPGHEVAIRYRASDPPALLEVELEPSPGRTVRAVLAEGTWTSQETLAPRHRYLARAEGIVDGGLFPAMTRAGLPPGLALSLIRVLGHQVDFQRDLQPGDRFTILFERYRDAEGDVLGHGQILHVSLDLNGSRLGVWRHTRRDGSTGWYDTAGTSLRRTFLRTPLDGARVSSRFGMRNHPVLGYNRMHRGIDFAAPRGTPVYAAADGVVISAKSEGGYGRMIRLRHAGRIETRYAHLSRFSRGIRAGRRVKQGDVIGLVGSTGMSTGPHLHYEVAIAGRTVNPARHITHTARLTGRELASFRRGKRQLELAAARIGSREEIAMAAD